MRVPALFLLCLGLFACSSATEEITTEWKKAGHSTGEFKEAKPVANGKCESGSVSGLVATVCQFPSADDAKKAEEAGWTLIADAVGSATVRGKVLVVVYDARNEDPSGRRLDEVLAAVSKD
jgi:hypothetical protein